MPLPQTTNVGTIMHELKQGRERPQKQRIAIALSHARKMGSNVPESPIQGAITKRANKGKKKSKHIKSKSY